MIAAFTIYAAALAAQAATVSPDPTSFEPPLMQYAMGTATAPRMGQPLRIAWETFDDGNRVTAMTFGGRAATRQELADLNPSLSAIRGQMSALIACDNSGAIVTFRNAYTSRQAEARWIQVMVTDEGIRELKP